jgi:hypothetical protein
MMHPLARAHVRSRLIVAFSFAVLCGGCSALAQKHANGVGTAFDATREYPRLFECVEGMGNVGLILLPYFQKEQAAPCK